MLQFFFKIMIIKVQKSTNVQLSICLEFHSEYKWCSGNIKLPQLKSAYWGAVFTWTNTWWCHHTLMIYSLLLKASVWEESARMVVCSQGRHAKHVESVKTMLKAYFVAPNHSGARLPSEPQQSRAQSCKKVKNHHIPQENSVLVNTYIDYDQLGCSVFSSGIHN